MALREEIGRVAWPASVGKRVFSTFLWISVLSVSGWYAFIRENTPTATAPQSKTFVAKKTDLKNSVEADGKVAVAEQWDIGFPISGTVESVLKDPGEIVKKGEAIALLDSAYLDLAIDKAEVALDAAEANYALKAKGAADSDLKISERQLESAAASYGSAIEQAEIDRKQAKDALDASESELAAAKRQAEISEVTAVSALDAAALDVQVASGTLRTTKLQETEKYENLRGRLVMESWQLVTNIEKTLYDVDVLLGMTDANRHLNDSHETYLAAKDASKKAAAENAFWKAEADFSEFYPKWKDFRQSGGSGSVESYATELLSVASDTNRAVSASVDVLKATVASQAYGQSSIDASVTSFENTLTAGKNATESYAVAIQAVAEAKSSMDAKIAAAENALAVSQKKYALAVSNLSKIRLDASGSVDRATEKVSQSRLAYEETEAKTKPTLEKEASQVDISKLQLEGKQSVDPVELEPLRIAIVNARKNLDEAKMKKADATLAAPADGKILRIYGSAGTTVGTGGSPFASLGGTGNFTVRADADEETVVKVKIGQLAYVAFSAIDGLILTGTVAYVDEKASFDANGIPSYAVDVTLSATDERVREGMSATAEFVTREKSGVVAVPVAAVRTVSWRPAVILSDGTPRPVVTGFTDAKMVEIVSGLSVGETVIY